MLKIRFEKKLVLEKTLHNLQKIIWRLIIDLTIKAPTGKPLEEEMGEDLYALGVQHFSYIGHKSTNHKISGIWGLIEELSSVHIKKQR